MLVFFSLVCPYLIFRNLYADVKELALGLCVGIVTSRDLVLTREVGLRDCVRAEVWRTDLSRYQGGGETQQGEQEEHEETPHT